MAYTYQGTRPSRPRRTWTRPKERIAGKTYMKVKDRHLIRELRKERGITQRQMAVLAKTSQATISSIETGALTNISVDLGVHLAKWLDRRPRELFDHFDDDEFTAVKMRNEARLARQNNAESVA